LVSVSVPATECPRISADFLESERSALGPAWFAQKYMTEFVENGMSLFDLDTMEPAIDDSFEPLEVPK
jgi:hypothetical protein